MVKFGHKLLEQEEAYPAFRGHYIQYKNLKKTLKNAVANSRGQFVKVKEGEPKGIVALTVPPQKYADQDVPLGEELERHDPSVDESTFFDELDKETNRISKFTTDEVQRVRVQLVQAQHNMRAAGADVAVAHPEQAEELRKEVSLVAQQFLDLEKFVNINFTGFYKILKKHDKMLPHSPPCRPFYMSRLHSRPWVRGDYSDVMVTLSQMYSTLRRDPVVEETDTAKGSFVRSTKKYWVTLEDVSSVKYELLQHLPVFLQKTMGGESDSQLVNSTYLDNSQLELYHGRLNKTPGAIAVRFRWYGTGGPKVVFVERKTHRDSWTGDVSVKERFIVKEEQVLDVLSSKYDLAAEEAKLRQKGKSDEEIAEWRELVQEILQQISTKSLEPTVRTQCMRTAFQIPFDPTVRVSLDTNLCMILDRDPGAGRWYRNPAETLPPTAITRFPHAILEVKLQVEDESKTPGWIKALLASGRCHEIHKFSKFTHGTAVLLHDDVYEVPYWIDDASLAPSIIQSGAGDMLLNRTVGANQEFQHLLPFTKERGQDDRAREIAVIRAERAREEAAAMRPRVATWDDAQDDTIMCCGICGTADDSSGFADTGGDWCNRICCLGAFGSAPEMTTVSQRVEPKVMLANERTFIHWLHMAVNLAAVSTAVLAFTNEAQIAALYAMFMLPVALLFIGYATYTFLWRLHRIRTRIPTRWDNPWGPMLLGTALVVALSCTFALKWWSIHTKQTTFALP